ncbi:MAG: class I SAM-dependent methyltransferase [Anaerolineales bacterium]|jgi:hypothetical protein
MKFINLITSPNRLERILSLIEIRFNLLFFDARPNEAVYINDLFSILNNRQDLKKLLQDDEVEKTVESIRHEFDRQLTNYGTDLPFPVKFNADKSFALLVYAIARFLHPEKVVETGIGYGMTSALILLALKNNGKGNLMSMDLHPLSDPEGAFIGIGVPQDLRKSWKLHSGSSRRLLPKIITEFGTVSLFVSDSANVFTLQRYEFNAVFPKLIPNGAMIFNNVSLKFQEYLNSVKGIEFYSIWQSEKISCVTIVVFKNPLE